MSSSPLMVDCLTDADIVDICCGHFARKCARIQKVTIVRWELRSFGDVPAGFLSKPYRLVVLCQLESSTVVEEVTFFIKTTPTGSAAHNKYVFDFGAFKKEVRMYRSLLPTMSEVVNFEFAPHCYLTKEFNLLAFEDLQALGYRLAASEAGLLDQHHLMVALESLATLHASSMIVEKQHNTRLDTNYPGYLAENAYPGESVSMESRLNWVSHSTAALSALIAEIPRYSTWRLDETRKRFEKVIVSIFDMCKSSSRYRNAFGHGDLWKNNVMFKYATISDGAQRKDTVPVEAKFVDFQLARYAPPALDVMTLCTCVTTSVFRQQCLDALLDAYYTHLSAVLQMHGLCVAVELPRLEFDASCEFFRLAGLIESCLFSHLVLLPENITQKVVGGSEGFNDFMNVSRVEICVTAFREDAVYRSRMTDMIEAILDEFVLPFMGNHDI